ncbi:hypothetical protein KI387_027997, partial [Taxus chinensis]
NGVTTTDLVEITIEETSGGEETTNSWREGSDCRGVRLPSSPTLSSMSCSFTVTKIPLIILAIIILWYGQSIVDLVGR